MSSNLLLMTKQPASAEEPITPSYLIIGRKDWKRRKMEFRTGAGQEGVKEFLLLERFFRRTKTHSTASTQSNCAQLVARQECPKSTSIIRMLLFCRNFPIASGFRPLPKFTACSAWACDSAFILHQFSFVCCRCPHAEAAKNQWNPNDLPLLKFAAQKQCSSTGTVTTTLR